MATSSSLTVPMDLTDSSDSPTTQPWTLTNPSYGTEMFIGYVWSVDLHPPSASSPSAPEGVSCFEELKNNPGLDSDFAFALKDQNLRQQLERAKRTAEKISRGEISCGSRLKADGPTWTFELTRAVSGETARDGASSSPSDMEGVVTAEDNRSWKIKVTERRYRVSERPTDPQTYSPPSGWLITKSAGELQHKDPEHNFIAPTWASLAMEQLEHPLTKRTIRRMAPTLGVQSAYKHNPYWADSYRAVETLLGSAAIPGEFDDGSSPYKHVEMTTPENNVIKVSKYDGDMDTWEARITMALEGEGKRERSSVDRVERAGLGS